MELVNATRKTVDGHNAPNSNAGSDDPAVREAVEFIAQALSLFAPYVSEEMWEVLGHAPSIADSSWPTADPALLAAEEVTMVVQVQGKVRAKLSVSPQITEQQAIEAAMADSNVQRALNGRPVVKTITKLPRMVSLVPGK